MTLSSSSLAPTGVLPGSSKRNSLQELGSDQFIALMVAQMKNQDPMKPTDPSEFLGQLAQFSTVSGVRAMQESMGDMVASLRSSQMLSGIQLVGRDVLAAGNRVEHDGLSKVRGATELPRGVAAAVMVVKDAAGSVVRQVPLNPSAGPQEFEWDGKGEAGAVLPAGRYSIEVLASGGGRSESMNVLLRSKVDSVTLDSAAGGLVLNTSNGALPLTAVRRVL